MQGKYLKEFEKMAKDERVPAPILRAGLAELIKGNRALVKSIEAMSNAMAERFDDADFCAICAHNRDDDCAKGK